MSERQQEHISECQRLKEAILGTEDLTGMLEASVPSASLEISVPLQSLQGNAIHAWGGSKHGCLKENMLWSLFDDLDGFIPSSKPQCQRQQTLEGLQRECRSFWPDPKSQEMDGQTTDN